MAARVVALGICGLVVRWRTRAAASDRGRRGCRLRTAAALPPHLYCTHAPPSRRERLHDEVRRREESDKEKVLDAAGHSWDEATITPLRVYRQDVSEILRGASRATHEFVRRVRVAHGINCAPPLGYQVRCTQST